jgi:hypothetical protein
MFVWRDFDATPVPNGVEPHPSALERSYIMITFFILCLVGCLLVQAIGLHLLEERRSELLRERHELRGYIAVLEEQASGDALLREVLETDIQEIAMARDWARRERDEARHTANKYLLALRAIEEAQVKGLAPCLGGDKAQ